MSNQPAVSRPDVAKHGRQFFDFETRPESAEPLLAEHPVVLGLEQEIMKDHLTRAKELASWDEPTGGKAAALAVARAKGANIQLSRGAGSLGE
jgi:hypothetical protein